jgi:DNA mismatch repair protein MutS2
VADGASVKLDSLRREVKAANERILAKLEKLIGDSHTSAMLQEAIITKRNGRYVVPLRAEFKSRMRCVCRTNPPPARHSSSSRLTWSK